MNRWVWISMPSRATFALEIENGLIKSAPPIARWSVGRPERLVADYYRRQGARFKDLDLGME